MQGRKIPNVPHLFAGGKLMVKTLLSILISIGLLVTAAVFENFFISSQFEKFSAAIGTLEYKVREKKATPADADTVKTLWDSEKKYCISLYRTAISPTSITGWAKHPAVSKRVILTTLYPRSKSLSSFASRYRSNTPYPSKTSSDD